MEAVVIRFFQMLKVRKEQDLPKRNTTDSYKSFLKNFIIRETKWDITDRVEFPRFHSFYRGLILTLKNGGKADTEHHREIPAGIIEKIYSLLAILHQVMIKNPAECDYDELLQQIPEKYRGKHHYLTQYGKIFFFSLTPLNIFICMIL